MEDKKKRRIRRRKKVILILSVLCLICFKYRGSFIENEIKEKLNIKIENNIFKHKADFSKDKLVLVNKKNVLQKQYVPKDLKHVNIRFHSNASDEEKYMRASAADALVKLFEKADTEGIKLYGLSGYRSYNTQKQLCKNFIRTKGKKYADEYAAKPGESEHQLGLAMDITNSHHRFPNTKEARWLKENAYKFGFILRYPKEKEDITGYNYEPWHIRYVGCKNSEKIYTENVVLEEYLN